MQAIINHTDIAPRRTLNMVADEELVQALLRKDDSAWRSLVRSHQPLILATIRRVLARFASRYGIEAEEVYGSWLSSLVAHDMAKLRAFDAARGTTLSTWLAMLASHASWDHVRNARRREALSLALHSDEMPSYEPDSLRRMLTRQECEWLTSHCASLSRRDQLLLQLTYVEGASSEEVARKLGISVGTVYTKQHKLRAKLRGMREAAGVQRRKLRRGTWAVRP